MATRRERILRLLETMPGLTDREITDQLEGHSAAQQPINMLSRRMEAKKIIKRIKRRDGLIGNYLVENNAQPKKTNHLEIKPGTEDFQIEAKVRPNNSEKLKNLIELGFEQVGKWTSNESDLAFTLENFSRETELLYAFIVDGDVKYIGKTTQELNRRIKLYKNCESSQRTNIRIRDLIRASLSNGSKVEIYAFVTKTPLQYLDIPINLAAGLEDNLIRKIDPDWNIL